ncbi:LA_2272 family surface repeat-containing protein [Bacteroides sp. UBA939]|uniref:LA_2272 family surface repeat-containing protein n=1 Tax=Bacteroides sp. UBA939 TaxID=1946092 RepID=UPI0025C5E98A|nr:hypothetical protein [Bacteroides sp. UBA939]
MRRLFLFITVLFLLIAEITVAQTASNRTPKGTGGDKEPVGINLSLWKNIATQSSDTIGSTCFNLGIYSSMNRLNGLGLNALGSVTERGVNGVQASGIFNMVDGNMRGIQMAGISNVNENNLSGISLSGLVGITVSHARGIVFSGLVSIIGEGSNGVVMSGLLNIAGLKSSGVHLAGLANFSDESLNGIATAGLLNITGGELRGMQIGGLANITGGSMRGIQIAGFANVVGGGATGLQIAPANVVRNGKGLQIGLFNYYKENFDGFQLGLVNVNPETKYQLMLFGGNTTKLNAGVRFKNKLFYTILGGGTHYLDFSDKFSASLFYRAGLELPLCKQLFISGDLGYQHIETFKNKDYGFPARLYALQARVNLEYRLTEKLGIFVTGGYGGSRYYNKGVTHDKGMILEGGVVLSK